MGKKLQSLRKIYAQEKHGSGEAPPAHSSLGKRSATPAGATDANATKSSKTKSSVDWKALEKKQAEAEGDAESGSDSEDEGSEDGGGIALDGNLEHVVEDYTFEFNDMREEYSEGICTMLRKFIANPTEAYNLATVITAQTIVGTVVNCEGGQDSFAFATVLPSRKLEKIPPMVSIINSLSAALEKSLKTKPSEELQMMKDCLPVFSTGSDAPTTSTATTPSTATTSASTSTGVLLHKRFTNLPIQLVSALHRNLEEDVSWAQQQASDEDDELALDNGSSSSSSGTSSGNSSSKGKNKQNKNNFFAEARNVLLLCECAVMKDKSGYTLSDNACYNVLGSCSDLVFQCFEDEVYLQHAVAAVLFRPPKTHCLTDLVALLVPISKLKTCVNGICELIPE